MRVAREQRERARGHVDHERRLVAHEAQRRVKRGLPPQRQPGEGRSSDNDDADDDRFDGGEV